MTQPLTDTALHEIRTALCVARAIINTNSQRQPNPWLDRYAWHIRLLLAERDRLRERVAELEARKEFSHVSQP